MMLIDLADWFREAGLTVIEEPDWKTRGVTWSPIGMMQHHTAPPNPYPIYKLYPPLSGSNRIKANFAVTATGVVHTIAAGACNYSSGTGSGTVIGETNRDVAPSGTAASRGLIDNAVGNMLFVNNETDHPGDGSPIPAAQYEACVKAWAVLCRHMGWTANRVISHGEFTARKIDPRWNGQDSHEAMVDMRVDVEEALKEAEPVTFDEFVKMDKAQLGRHGYLEAGKDATDDEWRVARNRAYRDLRHARTLWQRLRDMFRRDEPAE